MALSVLPGTGRGKSRSERFTGDDAGARLYAAPRLWWVKPHGRAGLFADNGHIFCARARSLLREKIMSNQTTKTVEHNLERAASRSRIATPRHATEALK